MIEIGDKMESLQYWETGEELNIEWDHSVNDIAYGIISKVSRSCDEVLFWKGNLNIISDAIIMADPLGVNND